MVPLIQSVSAAKPASHSHDLTTNLSHCQSVAELEIETMNKAANAVSGHKPSSPATYCPLIQTGLQKRLLPEQGQPPGVMKAVNKHS